MDPKEEQTNSEAANLENEISNFKLLTLQLKSFRKVTV